MSASVLRRLRRNVSPDRVEVARAFAEDGETQSRHSDRWGKRRRLVVSAETYRLAARRTS